MMQVPKILYSLSFLFLFIKIFPQSVRTAPRPFDIFPPSAQYMINYYMNIKPDRVFFKIIPEKPANPKFVYLFIEEKNSKLFQTFLDNPPYSDDDKNLFGWAMLAHHFNLAPIYRTDQDALFLMNSYPQRPETWFWRGKRETISSIDTFYQDVYVNRFLLLLEKSIKKAPHDAVLENLRKTSIEKKEKLEDAANYMAPREYLTALSEEYKIHLMPQDHEVNAVLWKLLTTARDDAILRDSIAYLKFLRHPDDPTQVKPEDFVATIVIYPERGKEHAQNALDRLVALFKDTQGKPGVISRFNIPVTSLISYAQSDGDAKYGNNLQFFDKSYNYALFKKDFIPGEKHDFSLKVN